MLQTFNKYEQTKKEEKVKEKNMKKKKNKKKKKIEEQEEEEGEEEEHTCNYRPCQCLKIIVWPLGHYELKAVAYHVCAEMYISLQHVISACIMNRVAILFQGT